MTIKLGNKAIKAIKYGSKNVKECWLGQKKVFPSEPLGYNLDPTAGAVGRLHDGELRFRVFTDFDNMGFSIPTYGYFSTTYDWNISVDSGPPVRYRGNRVAASIEIPMGTAGSHVVKVSPYGTLKAGWARCMGNGNMINNGWGGVNGILFSLDWIPGYAFMETENSVGNSYLEDCFKGCNCLYSLPNEINLPEHIKTVGNGYLAGTRHSSTTSIINWMHNRDDWSFKTPNHIESVGARFMMGTFQSAVLSLPGSISNSLILPKNIKTVGDNFIRNIFANSTINTTDFGLHLPQNIQTIGNNFMNGAFSNCHGGSLLSIYNQSHSFTDLKSGFMRSAFANFGFMELDPYAGLHIGDKATVASDSAFMNLFTGFKGTRFNFGGPYRFGPNLKQIGSSFFESALENTDADSSAIHLLIELPRAPLSIGDRYLYRSFAGCTWMEGLGYEVRVNEYNRQSPESDLGLQLEIVPNNFMYETFVGCTKLKGIGSTFNFPQKAKQIGDNFLYRTFKGCTSLEKIQQNHDDRSSANPKHDVTLSPNIEKIGSNFMYETFMDSGLAMLPKNFTLPAPSLTSGNNVFIRTFAGCTNLTNTNNPIGLVFNPVPGATSYGHECFLGTQVTPTSPNPGQTVLVSRNT